MPPTTYPNQTSSSGPGNNSATPTAKAPTPQDEDQDETEAIEDAATPQADVLIPGVTINGIVAEDLYRTEGRKLKGVHKPLWLFKPKMDVPNPFASIAKMVGVANLFRLIMEDVIRPACVEATKAAYSTEDGRPSVAKFVEVLLNYFVSEKRGGSGVRELRKKFSALTNEVMPYIAARLNPAEAQEWTEEEEMKYGLMVVEWRALSTKLGMIPKAQGKVASKAA